MIIKMRWAFIGAMVCGFLSTGLVFADTGNGGNFAAGQSAAPASMDQSSQSSPADSSAGGWGRHHWHGWRHHHKGFLKGLSEDQKKQLKENWQKQMQDMKPVMEQVKANRKELNDQVAAATPDINKINQLQSQLKALQAQMDDNSLNSILAVKKILSPEQFQQFLKFRQEHQLFHHGMRGTSMRGHDRWKHKRQTKDCGCVLHNKGPHHVDKHWGDQDPSNE